MYEISGPFFFGAAEPLSETSGTTGTRLQVLILRRRNIKAGGSTRIHAPGGVIRRSRSDDSLVRIFELRTQPPLAPDLADVLDAIDGDGPVGNVEEAFRKAGTHGGQS